jgi:hypothetical protein
MKYSPAIRASGAVMVGAGVMAVAEYAGMPWLLSMGVFILVVVGLYLVGGLFGFEPVPLAMTSAKASIDFCISDYRVRDTQRALPHNFTGSTPNNGLYALGDIRRASSADQSK